MTGDGRVYYNEFDKAAADWIENNISDGLIPGGVVDRRSIKLVEPADLVGFRQCHFFAGIGGWAWAAILADWPPSAELWSGSAPCQPFSSAGNRMGADDPRHLWPDFFRLIRARRPARVVGEQVAGKAGYGWLDGVASDLEGESYAVRAVDIPALAVNRPHQRQRLYWVAQRVGLADSARFGGERTGLGGAGPRSGELQDRGLDANGSAGGETVGQADRLRDGSREVGRDARALDGPSEQGGRPDVDAPLSGRRDAASVGDMADAIGRERGRRANLPRWRSQRRASLVGDAGGKCPSDGVVDALGVGRGEGRGRSDLRRWRRTAGGPDARGGDTVAQGDRPDEGLSREPDAGRVEGYPGGRPDAERTDGRDGGLSGVALGDTSIRSGSGPGKPEAHRRETGDGEHRRPDDGLRNGVGPVADSDLALLDGDGEPAGELAQHEPDPRAPPGVGCWITCHDGKARRIPYPGFSMLADGLSGRIPVRRSILERPAAEGEEVRYVSRIAAWRGFGNAIVPQLGAAVLAALLEAESIHG